MLLFFLFVFDGCEVKLLARGVLLRLGRICLLLELAAHADHLIAVRSQSLTNFDFVGPNPCEVLQS